METKNKSKSKGKKVAVIVANIVIWSIFIFSMFTVVLTLNTTGGGVPNVLGFGYLSVQSDSMEGAFYEGDLIFITTTSQQDIFKVDDVVTFSTVIEGIRTFNTHRIISRRMIGQTYYYTTQGDNEEFQDMGEITANDIVAKWTGAKLGGVGYAFDFLQTSLGFLLIIVLPLAGLFIYQVVNFGVIMAKFRREELEKIKKTSFENLNEEEKAEIAKKYLESLKAKEAADKDATKEEK